MTKGTNEVHDPAKWLKETNQKFDIFPYVYQFSLTDKVYISTIKNKSILNSCIQSATQKNNDTLAGDIQQEFKVTSKSAINQVKDELKWHLSNIFNKEVLVVKLNELWVNHQKATEYNPSHSHDGQFSFVIYAEISESIREEYKESFGNAKTRGLIQFNSQLTNDVMVFNPSKYTVLIFESSHLHQVYPFYSNETRISIAGNIADIIIDQ
jgi:hypothetical protein